MDTGSRKSRSCDGGAGTRSPVPIRSATPDDTGGCSTPAAVAGYPRITVPACLVHGLAVGISLFGTAWSEPVLLKLAYRFAQATKARRPPRLLKTVEFRVAGAVKVSPGMPRPRPAYPARSKRYDWNSYNLRGHK
jgi:hypothetical protein